MPKKDVILRHRLTGLDLNTILQVLREFSYTGIVQGTTYNIAAIQGPVWVYLLLLNGEITACAIDSSNGKSRFSGEDALHLILKEDMLDWTLVSQAYALPKDALAHVAALPPHIPARLEVEQQDAVTLRDVSSTVQTSQSSTLENRDVVPRRLDRIPQEQLLALPRLQRMVLLLADGKRSAEKIASILKLSQHVIEDILNELYRKRMIGRIT